MEVKPLPLTGTPLGSLPEALRVRDKLTASILGFPWMNGVVPLAMKFGWHDVELGHLGVGDFDAFVVGVLIEPALDGQTLLSRGAGNQLDDDLMGQQRFATPVLGDEGEQTMLDAVPFAGARRQMRNGYGQGCLIGQCLQLGLP